MSRPIDADRLLDDITAAEEHGGMGAVLAGTLRRYVMRQPTLTPPNEWVSVEERLPEEKQRVIVRCERVGTSVGWILWGRWMTDIGPHAGDVTHWMLLPAPPDKDNNVLAKTPNEPLTLEQLREMDGEPVWFDTIKRWGIVKVCQDGTFLLTKSGEFEVGYITRRKYYRRPPERQEDT